MSEHEIYLSSNQGLEGHRRLSNGKEKLKNEDVGVLFPP